MDFIDVVEFFAALLRMIGAATFGVGAGWLTIYAYKWEKGGWQLAAASTLGLLAAFVLIGHWVRGAATMGAFGLGAGAGLLIWGLREAEPPPPPPSRTRRTTRKQ